MLKKLASLVVVLAMIVTAFAGCTPDDIALYKAMMNQPESSVTRVTTDFDVTVEQPISFAETYGDYTYEENMAPVNYLIQIIGGLLSITDMESVITKSGNVMEAKLTFSMPDASFSFNTWHETDDNGQVRNTVISLPSYVRPFLPLTLSKKQYLSYSPAEYQGMMTTLFGTSQPEIGIIGGADGPTAIMTTDPAPNPEMVIGMLTMALRDEEMIDKLAGALNINYVTNVERTGGNTVYTVKLDGKALKSLVKGVISSLGKDEFAEMITLMTGATADEIRADIEEADPYIDMVCDFIIKTGILDNGVTSKYTVNRDGYVIKTEETMDMYIDLEKIVDAAIDLTADILAIEGENMSDADKAEMKSAVQLAGKLRIAMTQVSDVTGINVPNSAKMPELTDANCIDIIGDINEYVEYETAYRAWLYSWYDYDAKSAWEEFHKPGETLTLRNNDTGAEVVTVPKTLQELYNDEDYYGWGSIYVPLTDLVKVFDSNAICTWNDELKGVEVRYTIGGTEKYIIVLTDEGSEMYDESRYWDDDYNFITDERYDVYDRVKWYDSEASDGILYVDASFFNHDPVSYDFNYRSRFEEGKYCYTSYENARFKYDIDLSDNIIYAFENMFEY